MKLFERFEMLSGVIDSMNAEATASRDIPFLRLHDYVHYCDVQLFLHAYTRRLRLSQEETDALLAFCYEDTLRLKSRIGTIDLYAFTFWYFKYMTFRTGNLDTPDDYVEKLDMDRFLPYKYAREKQWAKETLSAEEAHLLSSTEEAILTHRGER